MSKTIKRCHMCTKYLGNKRRFYYINIEQNPPKLKFCSRACKLKYIKLLRQSNKKLLKLKVKNQ